MRTNVSLAYRVFSCRFAKLLILLVDLVGIEPTTSSMPWPLLNVLSTTYSPLGTAKRRGNTPKADI
jgi:hypothetical protein